MKYCCKGCQKFAWKFERDMEPVAMGEKERGHRVFCNKVRAEVEKNQKTVDDLFLRRPFDKFAFFKVGIVDIWPKLTGFEGLWPRK